MSTAGEAEWNGVKKGAISNAIRDRLHALVDQLSPTKPPVDLGLTQMEIVALLDQYPGIPEASDFRMITKVTR